mmetsp:Transcript_2108/g.4255  ORF Transcript_2108/g.4255 Transcript_2108/m.4255 type:complete len:284 (-) Transcript_2108:454-1305(-)|eukprot:CAMPEP_0118921580 /NCGR_PEP_ID=MMETSP1169-20130426/806_1 /TAXON_ID=36882 /ORGANISM="Pyramimonas obovata, Strain CCMP722" /LENGTH=283 /DNA_ID=CAMNT_0006862327 /DNA_START=9 /DNA_END=860 /DNA_ORIENTATION=+
MARGGLRLFAVVLSITSQLIVPCKSFYEKGSDVITLTKKNFDGEVHHTDMLYVVEFYREGCGYCQLLTPEYEKLAGSLKHMVKVGAVNTERESYVAGNHGDPENPISGVPTIKLFKPKWDSKVLGEQDVIVYNGERKAKAMAEFMMSHMPSLVKRVTAANLHKLQGSTSPSALLFTEKSSTAPLWKALSIEYRGRILLGEVSKDETSVCKQFGITEFPTIIALPAGASGPGDRYGGSIGFKSIDMFLWKFENKLKKEKREKPKEEKQNGKKQKENKRKGKDEL